MIKETHFCPEPEDEDFAMGFKYDTTGACTVAQVWVDVEGGCWLESNDGQRVVIPKDIRSLIAKRVRDLRFR